MEVTSSFEGGQKKWDPKSPLISSNKSSTAEVYLSIPLPYILEF